MTSYLGYSTQWLHDHQAIHTAQEISQQPQLWRALAQSIGQYEAELQLFISSILDEKEHRIIFTGAGTSAFAGEAITPFLQSDNAFNLEAIASTDIVSNPTDYLDATRPTLLVSFARSGNSPESVAAVNLADQLLPNCKHLFLTCNPEGALFEHAKSNGNAYCLLMPEGSNDQSFAMTSSLSCMMMAAIALLSVQSMDNFSRKVDIIADVCESKLIQWQTEIKSIAQLPYQRLIVLGSGGFRGLAQEAALKSLELSAGQITTTYDSAMGFRHGPKFSINSEALVLQFLATEPYTRQYDIDLYNEICTDDQVVKIVALSENALIGDDVFEIGLTELSDLWLCFPYLIFSQMLAFEKSLNLDLSPDNPCPTGEVNRVVQGVHIHNYPYQTGL